MTSTMRTVGQSPIISERADLGAEADYDEHNEIEHEGCDLAVYLGAPGLMPQAIIIAPPITMTASLARNTRNTQLKATIS